MLINDASFVVVDTETTGGRATSDRLIEIAAVRVKRGAIVDRFRELINPECTIPRRISWLTGITTAMVFDKRLAADIMPGFFEFLKGDTFVAHNALFDLRIVNEEQRRLSRPPLRNETLCTLRLARRLLPGLRSKGLSSLVDFYGIKMQRRHRALDDAEATAEILIRFLDQLSLEFGAETVDDALTFQYRRYGDLKQMSKHLVYVRENVLRRLPRQPGVYFMKDGKGKTIYIGKAQNLSSRVRSYFTSVEGHPARIRRMVKSVRDIEWQVTDSELEALFLESRLIKEHQPAYNRAQMQYVNRPFIRIETSHAFPRVSTSAFLHDDGSEYYGPMAGRNEAAFIVEVIDRFFKLRKCDDTTFSRRQRCVFASMGRCSAPCETVDEDAAYAKELDRVKAFLSGVDSSVTERIEAEMKKSAAELDFEQAGTYRDWLRTLTRMLEKREGIASRVLEHNVVIIHRPDHAPTARLLVVARGRHAETIHVGTPPADAELTTLEKCIAERFQKSSQPTESYREKEIDEIYLLSHWLFVHRNDVRQVRWADAPTVAGMVQRISSELARSSNVALLS
jgi:DNA polymerase-3 subunit epsilon